MDVAGMGYAPFRTVNIAVNVVQVGQEKTAAYYWRWSVTIRSTMITVGCQTPYSIQITHSGIGSFTSPE